MRLLGMLAALALAAGCRGNTNTPVVVGNLERERVELVAEAFEPIVEIGAREGEHVTAGQPIVRLDDSRMRAEAAQAEAARDQAQARLAELVRGPRPERIVESRAQLAAAESALAEAKRDLARTEDLATNNIESRQQLDLHRARAEQASAQRDAARAALETMLNGTTAEELEQAGAALAQSEAALAVARLRLERMVVRAPRDGYLDALPFHVGERPPAGAAVAVMLAAGSPYARVFVPETVRARVLPGTPATVEVDGIEHRFAARVRSVASDPAFTPYYALTERDRGHLAYEAKVDLTEPAADTLPSGVPVRVTLMLGPNGG